MEEKRKINESLPDETSWGMSSDVSVPLKKREIQQIYIILLDWKLSTNDVKQPLIIRYMVKSVGSSFSFLETNIEIMKNLKCVMMNLNPYWECSI